eukprot:scaffold19191_cov134-Isochrysis_galbana.AAC.4
MKKADPETNNTPPSRLTCGHAAGGRRGDWITSATMTDGASAKQRYSLNTLQCVNDAARAPYTSPWLCIRAARHSKGARTWHWHRHQSRPEQEEASNTCEKQAQAVQQRGAGGTCAHPTDANNDNDGRLGARAKASSREPQVASSTAGRGGERECVWTDQPMADGSVAMDNASGASVSAGRNHDQTLTGRCSSELLMLQFDISHGEIVATWHSATTRAVCSTTPV